MKRNNIKILTDEEIFVLNSLYDFKIENEKIKVICKNYNRTREHPINKSFFINSKVRKLTFTPEAMNLFYEIKDFSLIEIQNVVNILSITYQEINKEIVYELLRKRRINEQEN